MAIVIEPWGGLIMKWMVNLLQEIDLLISTLPPIEMKLSPYRCPPFTASLSNWEETWGHSLKLDLFLVTFVIETLASQILEVRCHILWYFHLLYKCVNAPFNRD